MNDDRRVPTPRIAILTLPEITASVAYGLYDLFRSAGRDWSMIVSGAPGEELFHTELVARTALPLEVANGVHVTPHRAFDANAQYDVVCVPELALSPDTDITGLFTPEIAFLRAQHARGAVLATACSGAVLLAEAGLLDACEATTHWAYCDALERRYPRVQVLRERALVVSGEGQRLVMAGGGTTWLDLGLYLIARLTSVEAAMQVARVNLIDWHATGQQPFARLARTRQSSDAAIGAAQTWIAKHFTASAPVASMVRLSNLPERTFKRRFKAATGMGPLEYVHALRIEAAKHLLETTDTAVETIALEVGYEDTSFFARLFSRSVKLSPARYRKRFGALGRVIGGASSRAVETSRHASIASTSPDAPSRKPASIAKSR